MRCLRWRRRSRGGLCRKGHEAGLRAPDAGGHEPLRALYNTVLKEIVCIAFEKLRRI